MPVISTIIIIIIIVIIVIIIIIIIVIIIIIINIAILLTVQFCSSMHNLLCHNCQCIAIIHLKCVMRNWQFFQLLDRVLGHQNKDHLMHFFPFVGT